MNRKTQKLIISVIAFICFAGYQYFTTGKMPDFGGNSGKSTTKNQPNNTNYSNDNEILDGLQSKKIIYTKHALMLHSLSNLALRCHGHRILVGRKSLLRPRMYTISAQYAQQS